MEKTITIEIPEAEAQALEIEIKQIFAEIAASQERMKGYQQSIERSKERTRATLKEIDALLRKS